VHNKDLIRWLCGQVNRETDLEKMDELLRLLKAVIQNDLEEVRFRTEYLRKKYAMVIQQKEVGDGSPEES
jgi:hypothetical protein